MYLRSFFISKAEFVQIYPLKFNLNVRFFFPPWFLDKIIYCANNCMQFCTSKDCTVTTHLLTARPMTNHAFNESATLSMRKQVHKEFRKPFVFKLNASGKNKQSFLFHQESSYFHTHTHAQEPFSPTNSTWQ